MHKYFYVYILTNKLNAVFYVGMTSDLWRRVEEHKTKGVSAFTSRYDVHKLVYYEMFTAPDKALRREDQLKKSSREKRVNVVLRRNPDWTELMPAGAPPTASRLHFHIATSLQPKSAAQKSPRTPSRGFVQPLQPQSVDH